MLLKRLRSAAAGAVRKAPAAALVAITVLGASEAFAARDRKAPTTPTNLQVTAKTAFSVSLSWSPSSDNSGSFSYVIHASNGQNALVAQATTSFTFTAGLESRHTYSFHVFAVDAAGNRSNNSNTVTVTLLADTIPPTTPVLVVTDVGATHVSLLWSSEDDGPFIFFQVFVNGSPFAYAGSNLSYTVTGLDPSTTYVITVLARDNGINYALSNEVSVTTEAGDPTDVTPPTVPGSLRGSSASGDQEITLRWDQSTDNVTPQPLIRYEIYMNGALDHRVVGQGKAVLWAVAGIVNTFEVVAIDEAGNASSPAITTVDLR